MSIREEFEKWFKAQYPFDCAPNLMEHNIAENAAMWMAERCARETEKVNSGRFTYGEIIRSLAQELSR